MISLLSLHHSPKALIKSSVILSVSYSFGLAVSSQITDYCSTSLSLMRYWLGCWRVRPMSRCLVFLIESETQLVTIVGYAIFGIGPCSYWILMLCRTFSVPFLMYPFSQKKSTPSLAGVLLVYLIVKASLGLVTLQKVPFFLPFFNAVLW